MTLIEKYKKRLELHNGGKEWRMIREFISDLEKLSITAEQLFNLINKLNAGKPMEFYIDADIRDCQILAAELNQFPDVGKKGDE